MTELVVLLDEGGGATGTAPKSTIHHASTPLHLAFSAYIVTRDGDLLVTRRARHKRTFPGVLTNSVCGHPAPGEDLVHAVKRRTAEELGMALGEVRLVLPTFAYVAEMGGVLENERCPVFLAVAEDHDVFPNPEEVMEVDWVAWHMFASDVLEGRLEVSTWCAAQVADLVVLGPDPLRWPRADASLLPPAAQLLA